MDEMLRILSRIYNTEDGKDFVEFLKDLSKQNYEMFKRSTSDMNDICKGQALAIDELIKVIETADEKLTKMNEVTVEKYEYENNPSF